MLQKLVYYAQAWSLAIYDRPLFDEEIEAWTHGPVVPSLFQNLKLFGFDAIPSPDECPGMDGETCDLLRQIIEIYSQHSAKHLEILTHREDPWKDARCGLSPEERSNVIISKESMTRYYRMFLDENG